MTNVQPDWAGAPEWAKFWAMDSDGGAYWYEVEPRFWAADSDGYAYWYRDKPTYNAKEEPDVSFDLCWPPEGFDNRDIDWASTLRSRP